MYKSCMQELELIEHWLSEIIFFTTLTRNDVPLMRTRLRPPAQPAGVVISVSVVQLPGQERMRDPATEAFATWN